MMVVRRLEDKHVENISKTAVQLGVKVVGLLRAAIINK